MRRMIPSRHLWWALSAAAAATAVAAAILLARRSRQPTPPERARPPLDRDRDRPASERDRDRSASGRDAGAAVGTAGNAAPWPPTPILGTPTARDIERYTTPSATFADAPAALRRWLRPNDAATRRRRRWAVAGLALAVLAGGTQVLEAAVFSKGGDYLTEVGLENCARNYPDAGVRCVADVESATESDTGEWGLSVDWAPDTEPMPIETGEVTEPQQTPLVPRTAASDADCHPRRAEPRVRKIDAKVTRAVNRQWRRIETWLKSNAPKSYRTLGRPGKATTIAVAEAQMGLSFPDDLRASLLRHNGTVAADAPWAFGFMGYLDEDVRGIRDTWRDLCESDGIDEVENGDPRTDWWDGRMIPVGSDGSGNHLVIDSVRHDVGETDNEDIMNFTPGDLRIRSYYALLKTTADALENDGTIGYWKPKAVAGELTWNIL
ncbi:hypothetical protein DMB42_20450 [Nonomuraea sp. WAC 01424]|nr:hypothetical protein DMB42_20450 [Nonomuraea sp. WAC 01424]